MSCTIVLSVCVCCGHTQVLTSRDRLCATSRLPRLQRVPSHGPPGRLPPPEHQQQKIPCTSLTLGAVLGRTTECCVKIPVCLPHENSKRDIVALAWRGSVCQPLDWDSAQLAGIAVCQYQTLVDALLPRDSRIITV